MIIALAALALTNPAPAALARCIAADCAVRGAFTISSDGHGFIGILQMADGCINVSVPDREAKRLLGKAPVTRTFRGRVAAYAMGDDIFEERMNGRRIGRGLCGDQFLFVR